MKKLAKVTSKGQVTIPRDIRRVLGVRPGDKLLFEKVGTSVHVSPVKDTDPFEKYRGIGTPGIGRGRKAVVNWIRKMRGHDDLD
jgi:antitoxin PrlF